MLNVFRDNLKHLKWVLVIVIAVFVLFIFTDFGGFGPAGGPGAATAATVGDDTVTVEEFRRLYQRVESQYRESFGDQFSPEVAKQMRLPIQVLDQLVNQKILLDEAARLGLEVSDEEMRELILSLPAFKDPSTNQFIGQQAYEQMLQANGFRNAADFESDVREDLLLQKLNNALLAGVYVSDKEVEQAYRDQVERAKIRYVQVPASQFAEAAQQLSQADLQAYFQAHQNEFRLPEQREAAYLLVDTNQMRQQVQLSDADLRAYYDEHKDEFSSEEQVRARHILVMINDERDEAQARERIGHAQAQLAGGKDFAAVARELSDDTASKAAGGDLGYFGRGAMVEEFANAAFGAQVGQRVGPVKTQYGFHIIEVTDKKPGGQRPFEQAKPQIQALLSSERVQSLAEAKAKEVAQRVAKEKPKTAAELEAIAKEFPGVTYATTGRFSQNEAVKDLGYAPAFTNAAFQLEKGKVSEAVQIPRGWAVLLLQEVHEPRVPQLADVQDQVRAAAARERQQRLAVQRLNAARAGGKTLDQVAAELGIEAKETPEFGANGSIPGLGFNPELTKQALKLKVGEMGGPLPDPMGAVLFQVTERKSWDPAEFAENREQTLTTVRQEKLFRARAALVEQRRRELGVEYDRALLESFGMMGDEATPAS